MDKLQEATAIIKTAHTDVKGDEIANDSLVLYNDPLNKVNGEAGYIVKNLVGVWEVRNVSEQTGTDLTRTSRLEIIGTIKKQ